jgi:CheY-like chemotaxis protein
MRNDARPLRRHTRGRPIAAAVVSNGVYAGTYTVENLSAGGALLVGPPSLAVGERVHLLLTVAAPRACSFNLEGMVLRRESRDDVSAFALQFRGVSEDAQWLIDSIVVSSLAARRPTALIVDDSRSLCQALDRDLSSLGWSAVHASTAADALSHLDLNEQPIGAIIVDFRVGPIDGLDILTFLTESHPAIRRVLMSSDLRHWHLDCAISSGRAHALLDKPWSLDSLSRACAD